MSSIICDQSITGTLTVSDDVTIGSSGAASARSLSILTGGSNSTVKLMEAGTVYGFSTVYDGATNKFHINRHNNSAAGTSVLSLNRDDDDAIFAGDVTVNGSHLKLLNHTGSYEGQSTDYLYIGGSGLDGADASIYLGNGGNDTGYGWRFFYQGTGSGNLNKLIIKSENAGSGVNALAFTQDGHAYFGSNVSLNDNAELQIGNSNDFYIKHDATNTNLINGVGKLVITNNAVDKAILFNANESSGAELYLGLLPSWPGVFVYKDLLMASDGLKLRMGASQDLEIFHDGSNSYIQDVGTGNLVIKGSTNVLISTTSGGQMAQFTDSGSAYLYHSSSLKFTTTSSGVTISGNINVSGTVDGRDVASDGSKLDGIASGATANAGTVTSVSASTATNAKGLSVSSGTTTPVVGLDIVGMGDYADGFDDGSIDYSQVFVPICDDDNGGGNKKTSVKSLLEGGVDSKHQFVLNSNFSDDTSSTGLFYMPFNSLSDTTSGQYYVHWAAPCTGRIKRVIMQHVYGSMSSGFTTQLQVYKNGSTFATSNELTVSTTNDGGYIEWNPTGSDTGNVSFVKGDRIRIRYQKSATGKYWRGVAASIIMELDQV